MNDFLQKLKQNLNKEIKPAKKEKPGKMPTKTTINLAMKEEAAIPGKTLAVYAAIAVVVLLLVVKFGVIDQYSRLHSAQAQYESVHAQYTQTQDALSHYGEVEAEYRRYSKDWMNDESSADYVGVNRTTVLDMVENRMMSAGTVNSITLQGNQMLVNMSGMNLEQISKMFSELEKDPIVKNLTLTIASTEEDAATALDFSVTVELQQPTENTAAANGEAQG